MRLRNAQVRFDEVWLDGECLSVAVPSSPNLCWLTSLCTAIGPMAREEARRAMTGPDLWCVLALSHMTEQFARFFRADQVVFPEHDLLSTSLYNKAPDQLVEVARALAARYPDRAIVVRSLTCPPQGHVTWPFRVVWIIADVAQAWMPRRDSRRDVEQLKALNLLPRHFTTAIDADRLAQCLTLYRSLYLDVHSVHNPDYEAEGLMALMRSGRLDLHTLETPESEVMAFCAAQDNGATMTLPLLGYDQGRPRAEGLYRAIMAHMALQAMQRGLELNLSAGAPHFKRHRGAQPWMEYLLIIDDHLPLCRKLPYRLIAWMLKRLEPRLAAAAGA